MSESLPALTWAPFVTSQERMRGASLAIRAVLGLAGLEAVLTLFAMSLVAGFGGLPDRGWDVLENAADLLAWLGVVAFVTAGVLFVRWQSQTLRNARSLGGGELVYGVRLAGLSWLVPGLNFFVPMRSLRQAARVGRGPDDGDTRALVGLWWALWILHWLLASALVPWALWADEPRPWIAVTAAEVASTGTLLVTGFVALRMLKALTHQHAEAARRLLDGEGLPSHGADPEAVAATR